MDISNEEMREFALRPQRVIPGQSLTTNPETPWPWETPPDFTTKEEAIEHFFDMFTEEDRHAAIMDSLADGVTVMELVQMFLTKSFQDGEINPDLMLILAEALAYLLMGLAEKHGIQPIIVRDEDEDKNDDLTETKEEATQNFFKSKLQTITEPQDDEDIDIQAKLAELPSLMAKEI